ncbi:MAG TPA: hypothetical protein VMN57_15050 [Anaerolineales bacterium]|nr:hypothetical protein [Anaerolineales bacterium]
MSKPTIRSVFSTWWPLAASWLFMGAELPLVSAVMARLPDPEISLAAYGGVVFPIALIVEAPIIMLLSASTALSKDAPSYYKLRRFMMWAGSTLTGLHLLLAFTPLFDVVVTGWMGVPAEIVEPSRIGLRIMLPWTWTIAYRRFQQGVLIRFGHARAVGVGTALRLSTNGLALWIGAQIEGLPGIAVGTLAIAAGVITEAIYAGLRVRPVVRGGLAEAKPVVPALSWTDFYTFYIPLAATSVINLIVQPLGTAAMSRMPLPLESLAVWPVLGGFLFMWRSLGFAYNEVAVARLDEPGAAGALNRFTLILSLAVTGGLTLFTVTPLSGWWFGTVSGLKPELAALAETGLRLSLLWPAISIVQNYYQGVIVHGRRTVRVTVSIVIFLAVTAGVLGWGVVTAQSIGLFTGLVAFQLGYLAQAVYLWWVCRPILRRHQAGHTPHPLIGEKPN